MPPSYTNTAVAKIIALCTRIQRDANPINKLKTAPHNQAYLTRDTLTVTTVDISLIQHQHEELMEQLRAHKPSGGDTYGTFDTAPEMAAVPQPPKLPEEVAMKVH